jgi:hypothetical protein
MLRKNYQFKRSYLNKCLIFGYYFKKYGIKFKYYKPNNFSEGKFIKDTLEWKSKTVFFLEKIGLKFLYIYFKEKRFQ